MEWRSVALGLAFAAMWSSAFTSARIVVSYAPPFLALSVRFLLSGLLALGIGWALGQRIRLSRAQWAAVVVFGLCQNALYLGLNFEAMRTVEAGTAAIIASMLPLLVAALGRLVLGERLTWLALAGLVAGFAGVLVDHGGTAGPWRRFPRPGPVFHRGAGAQRGDADAARGRGRRQPLDGGGAADAGGEPRARTGGLGAGDLDAWTGPGRWRWPFSIRWWCRAWSRR